MSDDSREDVPNPEGLPILPPPGDNTETEIIKHVVEGVEVPDPSDPQETAQFATPTGLPTLPPPSINLMSIIPSQVEDLADEPPINETEQILMLKHMALVPEFYNSVKAILEEIKYFSNTTSEIAGTMAGSIMVVLDEYTTTLPSKDMILHMFATHYQAAGLNTKTTVEIILNNWYAETNPVFDVKYLQDRLYALFKQYRKTEMLMQGIAKTQETFIESHSKYTASLESNPFMRVTRANTFDTLENMMLSVAETEKYPTNVWYFDQAMADGAMLGEAIGVLAPPSGGKTTCAMQLAYAQAYNDQYIAHISTEQALEGDLSIRAMSLVTSKARGYFEGGMDHWSLDERVDMLKRLEKFKEYHHFFDYTQTKPTNIVELLNPVAEMIKAGKKPVYVIIDWWGAIKDAMIAEVMKNNTQMTETETAIRRNSRMWLDAITKRAKDMGVVPIIFHQLSGSAAGKRGGAVLRGQDAQEDKQFENYFDFCLVFGPKDGDKNFTINPSKARRTDNVVIYANLNGAFCKIDPQKKTDVSLQIFNNFVTRHTDGEDVDEAYG